MYKYHIQSHHPGAEIKNKIKKEKKKKETHMAT